MGGPSTQTARIDHCSISRPTSRRIAAGPFPNSSPKQRVQGRANPPAKPILAKPILAKPILTKPILTKSILAEHIWLGLSPSVPRPLVPRRARTKPASLLTQILLPGLHSGLKTR